MRKKTLQLPSDDLERLRLEAGLTRAELSIAADITPNTLRAAEYGAIPTLRVQRAIAAALSGKLGRRLTHLDLWPLAPDSEPNGVAA